jgi:hypothetical protein
VTGRRARKAHNPEAAAFWRLAEVTLLGLGALDLGVVIGLVLGDWIDTGRWQVTITSAGVAFLGVPLGVGATVAHALRVQAIDGPPGVRLPDEDDDLPDPWDAGERLPAEETS